MTRVKTGVVRRHKHQKILKAVKGYYGSRSKLTRKAHEAYVRAGEHMFAGRKNRKRDMRRLWIQRINAALTQFGMPYREFIHELTTKNIRLNRKSLAELAVRQPEAFAKVVTTVQSK